MLPCQKNIPISMEAGNHISFLQVKLQRLGMNGKFQFVQVIPFNDNLILSLKSMWICSHIRTQLLDILSVHSFHVETVVLLSKNRITSYKTVEIGGFQDFKRNQFYNKLKIVLVEKSSTSTNTILQRASTYVSFSPVKLLYLNALRSFNHSIC